MKFLGATVGVVVIAGFFIASMFGYFRIKKALSQYKWHAEIITIGCAVTVSLFIKLAVYLCCVCGESALVESVEGMNAAWQALYATIGGLTFEG